MTAQFLDSLAEQINELARFLVGKFRQNYEELSQQARENTVLITNALLLSVQHLEKSSTVNCQSRRLPFYYINLNLESLAELANYVKRFEDCLYFTELFCDPFSSGRIEQNYVSLEPFDRLTELAGMHKQWFVDTQLGAYAAMGHIDGLHSLGETALATTKARIILAEEGDEQEKLTSLYSSSSTEYSKERIEKGIIHKLRDTHAVKYSSGFNKNLFGIYTELRDFNIDTVVLKLRALRKKLSESFDINSFPDNSDDSIDHLNKATHLEDLLRNCAVSTSTMGLCSKITKLNQGSFEQKGKMGLAECSVSFLRALSGLEKVKEKDKAVLVDTLSSLTCSQADNYRKRHMYQRSLGLLEDFHGYLRMEERSGGLILSHNARLESVLEQVRTLWEDKEMGLAQCKLKNIIGQLRQVPDHCVKTKLLLSKCLLLLGEFNSEVDAGKNQRSAALYEEAAGVLEGIPGPDRKVQETLGKAYFVLAEYAHERYRKLADYLKSPEVEKKEESVAQWTREITHLQGNVGVTTVERMKYFSLLRHNRDLTTAELDDCCSLKESFMKTAFASYFKCLGACDEYDLEIFRIVSIWFDNINSRSLALIVKENVSVLPSHKWLIAKIQLVARITDQEESKEPHAEALKKCRLNAAKKMILALRNSSRAGLFREMDRLAKAYMQMSLLDREILKNKKGRYSFTGADFSQLRNDYNKLSKNKRTNMPRVFDLFSVTNSKLPVPSFPLMIDKSAEYRNIVTLVKFEDMFEIFEGQNCPRVVKCYCSDGSVRKQLVKGYDDLRQDAVMQQVFAVTNELLARARQPGRMRTYGVVPLSPDSGVIEWCNGTAPISEILVGKDRKGGLHNKYYPGDLTGWQATMKMSTTAKAQGYLEGTFRGILQKMHPVFRHFFFETYLRPSDWFRRRKTYTESVAIASVGIAFEQGRMLRVPEMVPFRLTRDVVDPMGVCGLEGSFRRCSHREDNL